MKKQWIYLSCQKQLVNYEGEEVVVANGRFGPYIKFDDYVCFHSKEMKTLWMLDLKEPLN